MSTNERDDDSLPIKELTIAHDIEFQHDLKQFDTQDLHRLFARLQRLRMSLEGQRDPRVVRLRKSNPEALAHVRAQLAILATELSGRKPAGAPNPEKTKRIVLPPRLVFDGLLRRLMSLGAYERYIKPVIADMHHEYFESLAKKDESGARWAIVRGHLYVIPSWLWSRLFRLLARVLSKVI